MQHHVRRQLGIKPGRNGFKKRQDKMVALRQERRAKGLCFYCDRKPENGETICAYHKKCRQRIVKARKDAGRCSCCGKEPMPGRCHCERCHKRSKANWAALYAERRRQGLCLTCGKHPSREGRRLCQQCADKEKTAEEARRQKRLSAGLCEQCGREPRLKHSQKGVMCYLKTLSTANFGTMAEAGRLLQMFRECGGICPYSGRLLILGKTASLDHKLAVARGGKMDDPENVQWVHTMVNQSKRAYTDQEFLSLVEDIYNHRIKPHRRSK